MYPAYAMIHDSRFGMFSDSFFIQPKKGMIIVFPSFIPHYTMAHEDTKERIICSANAQLFTDAEENDHFSQDGKGINDGE